MSYILDALRKSESERQQGRIPDLGQQVQLIHRPRKRGIHVGVWVALALCLNALIVGVVFWPESPGYAEGVAGSEVPLSGNSVSSEATGQVVAGLAKKAAAANTGAGATTPDSSGSATADPALAAEIPPEAAGGDVVQEQSLPTVIVPSPNRAVEPANLAEPYGVDSLSPAPSARVPHLVELPMSFQKRVPTLIFNSHVYASDPAERRVIINDHYLRIGDTFSGIRVDRITEDGVELSMDGQRFRVGVVRDWISPH